MIEPTKHPEESIRLNALSDAGIMGSVADNQYDDYVTIASTLAGTPISVFSLVDDKKQWFRAKVGINVNETPRNVSFCGHAILNSKKAMDVEDALFDMRFCDNPLVVNDPGIRFYAGIPICMGKDGLPIGTICVIDRKPRVLEAGIVKSLVALGRILEKHLENNVKIVRLMNRYQTMGDSKTPLQGNRLIKKTVQQVDSAEASTIAVPPSDLSGSPR